MDAFQRTAGWCEAVRGLEKSMGSIFFMVSKRRFPNSPWSPSAEAQK